MIEVDLVRKRQFIFVVILMQTILAIAAGFTVAYLTWEGSDKCTLFVGEYEITGLSREEAEKALEVGGK